MITDKKPLHTPNGFTLIELMISIAIVGILSAIAIPNFLSAREKARMIQAVSEIKHLEKEIMRFMGDNGRWPLNLGELNWTAPDDPWGNPYQYTPVAGTPVGALRKDRFLVPVNTDFDLYSMGPDGRSVPPFTAKQSRDDIVRANNGGYIGYAQDY